MKLPVINAFARARRGYVMLVALILMAILAIIGTTSLSVAGIDQRMAYHNRKYVVMMNTAIAGTDHGRNRLETVNPTSENLDSAVAPNDTSNSEGADSTEYFVTRDRAQTVFEGIDDAINDEDAQQNLGVYWVEAIYIKCGSPPPGYSTEEGPAGFRSDYWSMSSTARMKIDTTTWADQNLSEGRAIASVRKVLNGSCKIR